MAETATEVVSGQRRIGGMALDERVRRAAAVLAALGVERGDCVTILLRNGIAEFGERLLAVVEPADGAHGSRLHAAAVRD